MNIPQQNAEHRTAEAAAEGHSCARGFMDYKEGEDYDGIGRKVQELIMKTHSFIIFIDEFGGVQWGYDKVPVTAEDYNSVTNRVAELEVRSRFLRTERKIGKGVDVATHQHALFSARRLIAEGMARLLDTGSVEAAHRMLDIAEKWISQGSQAHSRRWLLLPFLFLALSGITAFFYLVLQKEILLESGSPWLWLMGGVLGGLGALVSSVLFNRSIPFDATAGMPLHFLEAGLRWTVGFVAGLTAQFLVQGDLILGFLGGDNASPVAGLVLSLLAGSSELFFPTMLKRFDSNLPGPESGGK